ncbi:DUF2059 domain-containing protein [Caulobacter sp. UNC279MFTsu5.1]|uniref:DUF2059 domain-containing protein n=1 Tax=Caulobacter sp. UNC279MFTsu5.1 TaxID=1502775 RepID=UPI0008EFFEAB|nr:DUF2059 domain-containing protein [Caulobacter sp. UNC279MFTsu5.1]SFJ61330.1 hypothetical protein SAMN02799626_02176 [Caulobacter sp. UNC279MFTsu5.1]
MKRLAVLAAAAALCLTGGAAQARQASPPAAAASKATPETRALAARYFEAIHYDKLLGQMMDQMIPVMVQTLRTQTPSLTDEQSRLVSETVIESTREMTDKMKAPMIDAVAEVFTEQELRELVAFYEAPTGQALIAKTPELTQKMMAQMPAIMAEMQGKMLQKLCAKVSCAAPPPAPKATKS